MTIDVEMALGDLLPPPSAADHLRTSPSTLRRWRGKGIGPPTVAVAGRVMYRRSDLDSWVSELEASFYRLEMDIAMRKWAQVRRDLQEPVR
jgi:hypothetical protein